MLDKLIQPSSLLQSLERALEQILRMVGLYFKTLFYHLFQPKILFREAVRACTKSTKPSFMFPFSYFLFANIFFVTLIKFLHLEENSNVFNQVFRKLIFSSSNFAREVNANIPFFLSALILAYIVISIYALINYFTNRILDPRLKLIEILRVFCLNQGSMLNLGLLTSLATVLENPSACKGIKDYWVYLNCLNPKGGVYLEGLAYLLGFFLFVSCFRMIVYAIGLKNERSLMRTSVVIKKYLKFKITSLKIVFMIRLLLALGGLWLATQTVSYFNLMMGNLLG
ncbi:MAG: hypothetical protein SFT81_04915 [Candidatus Caenarcaniphilales bacterium]|nr:hypothetical protein [Candidatus Caenarcaniphilales bacterium]